MYLFENLLAAKSLTELHAAVRRSACSLGFSSFHYGTHLPIKTNGGKARFLFDGTEQKSDYVLSDYPESWFQRYQEQNYIEIDPLVRHCSSSILPIAWHRLPCAHSRRVRQIFDEAREHRLIAGATFSILGRDRESAIFSLTCDGAGQCEKRNIESRLPHGHMLLAYLHEATKRIVQPDSASFNLTARERECLTWVAVGKTSWEISQILRIAERTVIFHINNAARKLDTTNRTQAVARAMTCGLIHP
ncbi:MAG TPA: LuxR family transcriptional regulator [Azospira sp.]|nr:LuxR family transcriptional regulator [Azospira sp.]